jgi:hypothetical protein
MTSLLTIPALLATLFVTASSAEAAPEVTPVSEATPAPEVDESALLPATVVDLRTDEGQTWIQGVRTVLDEELAPLDRRRLGRKVLSASRVRITKGSFGAGATAVVTVNVELRRPDPEDVPLFISGVFTLDEAGQLGATIVPLQSRPQRYELESIGDTDGDAIDDLVLTVSDDESEARRLVSWPGGTPTERALPAAEPGC